MATYRTVPTGPGVPKPGPRKSNGCLRGCLIFLVVMVLLLVAGTVAALTVGRAYVVRRLPEWEARYPLLGLGIELLNVRQQFTSQGGVLPTGGRQAGSDDKALLPSDVIVHPSPRAEAYNISPNQVTAFQRVAAPLAEVLTYLRDAWTGHGWSLHDEGDIGGGAVLVWTKGNRACRMEVMPADRTTEIWLRCSTQ